MQLRLVLRGALALTLASLLACSDSATAPRPGDPSGVYSASEFTTRADGVTSDQLAEGVTLTLRLAEDGTTSGMLSVPAASDTPVDLTGTWTRAGATITFAHPLETFLEKLVFTLNGDRLSADGVVGPNFVHVTLTR